MHLRKLRFSNSSLRNTLGGTAALIAMMVASSGPARAQSLSSYTRFPASILSSIGGTIGAQITAALFNATGLLDIPDGSTAPITTFHTPTQPSGACQSNEAGNGDLYMEELLAGKVGVLTPSGSYSEIRVGPVGVVGVPRYNFGSVWAPNAIEGDGLLSTSITKINIATHQTTEYPINEPVGSFSDDSAPGADGLLYIDSTVPNVLTSMNPDTGKIVATYHLPGNLPGPFTLNPAPGTTKLWTNSLLGNYIVSFDTSTKKFQTYPVPTPGSVPDVTVIGPNGTVWWSEFVGDKIGELNPATGVITEFKMPSDSITAWDIEYNHGTGANGAMLVADLLSNRVYRFDIATSTFTEDYLMPTLNSAPCATGFANGNVYVGELLGGNVASFPDK